jgi:hypothetical protein
MTARPGFTIGNWRSAPVFDGHCATPADVEGAAAVFALADTLNGRPVQMDKPAPVIWYSEDEEFAALVVQAEAHETEDDGLLEFLGLLLPTPFGWRFWRPTAEAEKTATTIRTAPNGPVSTCRTGKTRTGTGARRTRADPSPALGLR